MSKSMTVEHGFNFHMVGWRSAKLSARIKSLRKHSIQVTT